MRNPMSLPKSAVDCFKLYLSSTDYDIFRIFKQNKNGNNPRLKQEYQYYCSHLQEEAKKCSTRNNRLLTRFIKVFSIYLWFKSMLAGSMQFYLETVHFNYENRASEDSFKLLIYNLSLAIGNPLVSLDFLAYIVYIGAACCNLMFQLIVPIHYVNEPVDLIELRLWMSPDFETQRINLLIKIKIDELLQSIDFYQMLCLKATHRSATKQSLEPIYNLASKQDSEERSFEIQVMDRLNESRRQLINYKTQTELVKPKLYSSEGCRSFAYSADKISIYCCGFFIIWYSFSVAIFFIIDLSSTCKAKNQPSTSMIKCHNMSPQEIVFLAELLLMSFLSLQAFFGYELVFLLASKLQLDLIRELRASLMNCLKELAKLTTCHYGQPPTRSELATVNYSLLETLTKVVIIRSDLKNSISTTTKIVSVFFVNSLILLVMMLVMQDGEDSKKLNGNLAFYIINIICSIIVLNCMFLICANIYIKYVNCTEKSYWTLLAESAIIKTRMLENGNNWRGSELDYNLTLRLWQKLAYSANFTRHLYKVRPLNLIGLDYEKILSLNFFIVSLYSLRH